MVKQHANSVWWCTLFKRITGLGIVVNLCFVVIGLMEPSIWFTGLSPLLFSLEYPDSLQTDGARIWIRFGGGGMLLIVTLFYIVCFRRPYANPMGVIMCVASRVLGATTWLVITLAVDWEDPAGFAHLFFVAYDLLFAILSGICLYFAFTDEAVASGIRAQIKRSWSSDTLGLESIMQTENS
jgi:hypothetical protein